MSNKYTMPEIRDNFFVLNILDGGNDETLRTVLVKKSINISKEQLETNILKARASGCEIEEILKHLDVPWVRLDVNNIGI